ncbi:MAG: MFS transporter [Alphaproteobacteria bacterium]|nr:MFS transporter [Alphaproteobacteria bacterium]
MSVVTIVRKGNRAAIAADTLYSLGDLRITHAYTSKRSKLIEIPNGWMGLVGSTTHHLVMKSIARKKPELLDFSSEDAIFESLLDLQEVLTEDYYLRDDEDDDDQPYDSNQLVGLICNGWGIFGMSSYREVAEYDRFWAAGNGDSIALGAMYAVYDQLDDVEAIARIGAEAACAFDDSCGLPVHVQSVVLGSPAPAPRSGKKAKSRRK